MKKYLFLCFFLPLFIHAQSNASQTFALVIGISDYQDEKITDLRFADKDAIAFANYLKSPVGGEIDDDHLKLLINEQATSGKVAAALYWLIDEVREGDQVIIYFSGHGDVERKISRQPGFLLCWDAPSEIYMSGGVIELGMLQSIITTLSVDMKSKVTLITDACRSGKLSGGNIGGAQITGANLSKQFANEIKILSCQPDEYSIEGEQWGGGRGAFSYHLLDGLYGLADGNKDFSINLMEVGRYLEDKVSEEVAPLNQLPMIVGNGREKLTDVDPAVLAELKEGKNFQLSVFTATETRGIEDVILEKADSNVVRKYRAFKKALDEGQFLIPAQACADFYFNELIKEPSLERLHASMRRNYAAALQDKTQQVMNGWMKRNVNQDLPSKGDKKKQVGEHSMEEVMTFPACLEKAAELLGERHYMYATLLARRHFFEGYLLANADRNPNEKLGRKALKHFRKSLELQEELPQAYWQMSKVYGYNLLLPDSAEVTAQKAMDLYPSWIFPANDMAWMFITKYKKFDRAKYYLDHAHQLDSNSIVLTNTWGLYYAKQKNYAEAEKYYQMVIERDSTNKYACNNLGIVYQITKRYEEAERFLKRTIALDPTYTHAYNNLGIVYKNTDQFKKAEEYMLRAIEMDPVYVPTYSNLGNVYRNMNQFEKAVEQFKKSIELDSTKWVPYANLSLAYQTLEKWDEALKMIQKSMKIGPNLGFWHSIIGNAYTHIPDSLDAAKIELDKAIEMMPDFPDSYIYLAQWSLKNNQHDEAWTYLEQGLQRGMDNALIKEYDLQEGADFAEMRKDPKWEELMDMYLKKEE